ncbi:MAG: response regulator [Candidatus Nomurabacteria bacterium]|nr:response regulator [Candidatus Nomurabacteria bacterium]
MNNQKKLILIVEDEESYRNILQRKLELEGFEILTTKDGEEGLSISLEKHPDLILLDLNLPKIDGLEMLKRLRNDSFGKNVKVIILTNFSDLDKKDKALEHEVFYYFVKTDIKLEDLILKIKEFIK